jgi:TPP-dependent pyruvate/acetoin dehydrogenase alpha subunit
MTATGPRSGIPQAHTLHLNRDHALDLLSEMLRIRAFEARCAELYTDEKIRGFLHLYSG